MVTNPYLKWLSQTAGYWWTDSAEYNTMDEVDYILEQVPPIVKTLRQMSPVWYHMLENMPDPYKA